MRSTFTLSGWKLPTTRVLTGKDTELSESATQQA